MKALAAAEGADVKIVSRQPTRMVLAWVDGDVMLRVAVVLHTLADGVQLRVVARARRPTRVYVTAIGLSLFLLWLGLAVRPDAWMRYLMFALGGASLTSLIASWRASTRARRSEFIALIAAVDRAVGPLKPVDERPFRALTAGRTRE